MTDWMTTSEAALALGVAGSTIRRRAASGRIENKWAPPRDIKYRTSTGAEGGQRLLYVRIPRVEPPHVDGEGEHGDAPFPEAVAAPTTARPSTLGKRILVIPDTQTKEGVPLDHLTWIGKYILDKRPDVVVHIGDHWDMPSLCGYDKGKKDFEGRRYSIDIESGNRAMDMLTSEYRGVPGYAPREIFLLGNHEQRIERAQQDQAEFEGVVGYHHLNLKGWEVHAFQEIVEIDGVKFSHYFTSGLYGRPVSSAAVLLKVAAGSAVMGHTQKVDMAVHEKTGAIALMAGICYQHVEKYLGPQGNNCRRQVVMLNEVRDGLFDPMLVSLRFLSTRYGGVPNGEKAKEIAS